MGHTRQPHRNIGAILAALSHPCTRLSWTTLLDRRMDVLASRSWSIARPRKRGRRVFSAVTMPLMPCGTRIANPAPGDRLLSKHSTPQHLPRRAKSKAAPFGAGVQWRQRSNEFSSCCRHPPLRKVCRQAPGCRSVQGRSGPTGRLVRQCLRLLFQSHDNADDLGAHI